MRHGHRLKAAPARGITEMDNKPKFRRVSPIVYWDCWFFAVLNILFLGPAIYLSGTSTLPLIRLLPAVVWAGVYLFLGLNMAYALLTNKWWLIKLALFMGLFVKALFAWALLLITLAVPANLGVSGLWAFAIVVQIRCLIYFTPEFRSGLDNR